MKQSDSIYVKIQNALNDLPGTDAHHEMYPRRKIVANYELPLNEYRISAVLALLYTEESVLKMVLTQRHDYKGKHGGQISFPGGKKEEHDLDTTHTALRETEEEIGLPQKKINILGKLTEVYIPVSKFVVHPYLGYFEGVPDFIPSDYEVKEIISFELNALFDETIKTSRDIKTGDGITLKNIPCFIIEEKIVWGATALMLNEIKIMLAHLEGDF